MHLTNFTKRFIKHNCSQYMHKFKVISALYFSCTESVCVLPLWTSSHFGHEDNETQGENKKSAYICFLWELLACIDQCTMWAVRGSQPLIVLLFQCKVSWLSLVFISAFSSFSLQCHRSVSITEQAPSLLLAWYGVCNTQERCSTKLAEAHLTPLQVNLQGISEHGLNCYMKGLTEQQLLLQLGSLVEV